MSADSPAHDPALGRRALITGAAVLGAAGIASVASASDASAANGDSLRIGREDNLATASTTLTVDRARTPSQDPALKVIDNRTARKAIEGQASREGTGVTGIGQTGVNGVGQLIGGAFSGRTGVDGLSVDPAGTGVSGRAPQGGTGVAGSSSSGTGVKGTSSGGRGVEGASAAAAGVGVIGSATHASGVTQGVRGDATASPLGTGAVGLGQAGGVYGEARAAGGKGVSGYATQESGAASHGVYGASNSAVGAGVYGKSASYDPDLAWNVTSFGVYAEGAIASSGPAFLGVPEYGTTARSDSRLQEGTMTFSADFTTASPRLIVLVKNTDGRLFKAELPLTAL